MSVDPSEVSAEALRQAVNAPGGAVHYQQGGANWYVAPTVAEIPVQNPAPAPAAPSEVVVTSQTAPASTPANDSVGGQSVYDR